MLDQSSEPQSAHIKSLKDIEALDHTLGSLKAISFELSLVHMSIENRNKFGI